MPKRLGEIAKLFKQELNVYRLVMGDPRTPRLARLLLGLAIGYALLPFDLIPDWIPLLGHLDDLIIVPGLVVLAVKLIPPGVVEECRKKVKSKLSLNP